MTHREQFDHLLAGTAPILALAPMQDVTDQPFWALMSRYGGADLYYTEYFRVHGSSSLDKHILRSITHNPTGRPAIAQMIGNDIPALVRTAKELLNHPVVGIDLNLGCPAPIVYRKCAGGGLLREPGRVDLILGALREAIPTRFTVKTRVGFDSHLQFDTLLDIFARHQIDLLTVHGRTVFEGYGKVVHYDLIARAAQRLSCPVLANGSVFCPNQAVELVASTGVKGLMLGRGAIRNPWLFSQIRQRHQGLQPMLPTGRQVLAYVAELYQSLEPENVDESLHVQRLKKYMNFLCLGVPRAETFLHDIRRVNARADFFRVCHEHLDHDQPLSLIPATL